MLVSWNFEKKNLNILFTVHIVKFISLLMELSLSNSDRQWLLF